MVRTVWIAYGTEERRGGQDDRQHADAARLVAGRSVARWWRGGSDGIPPPEPGRVPALHSPLLVVRPGERLAMAWTVETSDGAEEMRGTGEEVGGILRHGSLSFCFVRPFSLLCLLLFLYI